MTQQRFSDVLNEALDRLARGATVEECLASHQELASELEPLLLAAQAAVATGPVPRPEARGAILAQLAEAWQGREARRRHRRLLSMPSLPPLRPWAVAAAAAMALVLGGWGTAAAAAESLPGDAFYPVKETRERLLLAVTPSATRKAQLHARLAGERAREMEVLAAEGQNEGRVQHVAERMAGHTQKAVRLVDGRRLPPAVTPPASKPPVAAPPEVRPRPPGRHRALAELRQTLSQHEEKQGQRFESLPPGRQRQFREAYRESREELKRAIQALERLEAQDDDDDEDDKKGRRGADGNGRNRGGSD
jgi:hypothetical protein